MDAVCRDFRKSTMVSAELESLMGTAQIVFFLIGAMTIVEVVDAHDGTSHHRIRTQLSTLRWLVGFIFFSALSWTT
jgi:hypothetical protein